MLFDDVIAEVKKALKDELWWLTNSYGKAQRLVYVQRKDSYSISSNRYSMEYVHPAIYVGNDEYLSLLPGEDKGNFSFFLLGEPQVVNFAHYTSNLIRSPYDLIFWFDISTINEERNIESVKQEILDILIRKVHLKKGGLIINQIYEKKIYEGFYLREVLNQYLMQPYCGLRFSGIISVREGVC